MFQERQLNRFLEHTGTFEKLSTGKALPLGSKESQTPANQSLQGPGGTDESVLASLSATSAPRRAPLRRAAAVGAFKVRHYGGEVG